jgi:tRNA nucleotidyltransferase/poly(A) polymerase
MPDYIYLLENRLSRDQQHALRQLRDVAREAGVILFLTGDAVRDLTSGHAVRDLEVAVHGNALKLKKPIERLGGKVWGEHEPSRTLYLCFPGTVRIDLVSTHRVEYPRLGKAVYHPASIQEDLRRRDFTANAMAISLNEGSFGLLMDPLNGAADIEARTLRLVSNYGFLEEPSLLIRATRYKARLGWELDPRSQTRYENAREEGVIEALSDHARSFELEQIGHEDEALKVLQALETDGWMNVLFPAWTAAKADEAKLTALHDLAVELLVQGVHPDMSAAQMQLLTAKLAAKDLAALKKLMLRSGFVDEWNDLDQMASGFQKVLLAKENQVPSALYKLFTNYDPEAVLWLGFTSNSSAVKERYQQFLKVWPEARQRIPHALMQEMRITPELAGYNDLLQQIFLELIDGKLTTVEEQKAFLEPFSPPAPPPQVTVKRSRARRNVEKVKERSYEDEEESDEESDESEDLDDLGTDDEDLDIKGDEDEEQDEEEAKPAPAKHGRKEAAKPAKAPEAKPAKVAEPKPVKAPEPPKTAAKTAKPTPAPKEKTPAKAAPKPAAKAPAAKPKAAAPAKKAEPVKAAKTAKVAQKPAAKKATKPAPKPAVAAKPVKPAKHAPAKKKPAAKPVNAARTAKPAAKKTSGKSQKRR